MERFCIQNSFLLLFVLVLLFSNCFASSSNDINDKWVQVRVGLVLDLGSVEGKIVTSSVSMALSDFYASNTHYKTRVSLSLRSSQGDPLLALASAEDLLKSVRVEAILGINSLVEAKLMAELGEKDKVPVILLNSPMSLSLSSYSHLIQVTHDYASEAKGITAFINGFHWNSVVLVYEYHDDWRETMQLMVDHFHENNIRIQSKIGFTVSSSEDSLMDQLRNLKDMETTTVFVVHLSEVIATRLFQCVEKLGMMSEGFVWILTAKSMSSVHERPIDDLAKEAMEGVVGFKSYIPMSKQLHNFTSRWRKSLSVEERSEITRLSISGLWAHDIAWCLASAAEVTRMRNISSTFLEAITKCSFKGLSGDFQLNDKKLFSNKFEIVNMIGSSERRIGFWNSNGSFNSRRQLYSTHNNLETIIWPGGSVQIPRQSSRKKKLRVLVTSSNRFPRLMNVDFNPVTHEIKSVEGFCIDVFEACIAPFKYEVEYIRWRNGPNYDNLAYLLHSQKDKYDAAVGDITITSNRSMYVDFTLPFTEMGLGIVAAKDTTMWVFFEPLKPDLWITCATFFVLTGIIVWLIERHDNSEFQGSWSQQIGVVLWFGFSTLVYAHREKLKHNLSRFVVTVWVFAVLILVTSYTATLTSMMTVQQIRFNSNKDYVGHLSGSYIANEAFTNSTRLKMKLLGLNTSDDYANALLNKTVSYIVSELPYLKVVLGQNPARFLMFKTETTTNGFGFMFQKGSELVPNVSREIAKLRTSKGLDVLERKWFDKQFDKQFLHPTDDNSNPLTLHRFRGLFIIIGISFGFALVVLLILWLRERWQILVNSVNTFLSQQLGSFMIHFTRTIHPSPRENPIGPNAVQMAQRD